MRFPPLTYVFPGRAELVAAHPAASRRAHTDQDWADALLCQFDAPAIFGSRFDLESESEYFLIAKYVRTYKEFCFGRW